MLSDTQRLLRVTARLVELREQITAYRGDLTELNKIVKEATELAVDLGVDRGLDEVDETYDGGRRPCCTIEGDRTLCGRPAAGRGARHSIEACLSAGHPQCEGCEALAGRNSDESDGRWWGFMENHPELRGYADGDGWNFYNAFVSDVASTEQIIAAVRRASKGKPEGVTTRVVLGALFGGDASSVGQYVPAGLGSHLFSLHSKGLIVRTRKAVPGHPALWRSLT